MLGNRVSANSSSFRLATLDQFSQFDAIIDVRSPAEYAIDHVPGAHNCPVLSNEERAHIGTLHKHVSPFAAKREGAALVAKNIGHALEAPLFKQERSWRPLVMCWRGGKRSGSLTHVLRQIGWNAQQLEGGYRAYRALVNQTLEQLPAQLRYVVIAGRTGSGKSRLLAALAARGAQVLDLEELANHRGSVLGAVQPSAQPSQKRFDSLLVSALSRFDAAKPVFVESESKKIGDLRVPDALMQTVRASLCAIVEAGLQTRTSLLMDEYQHFVADTAALGRQLDCLKALHGAEKITQWKTLAQTAQWHALVHGLLREHYDPAYDKSMHRNFAQLGHAQVFTLETAQPSAIETLAEQFSEAYRSENG
jgi:tRNA 2-selenouridine synthase